MPPRAEAEERGERLVQPVRFEHLDAAVGLDRERIIAELEDATRALRDAAVAQKKAVERYQQALQAFNKFTAPEITGVA